MDKIVKRDENIIRKESLLKIREEVIGQLVSSEIDESYFRRKLIIEPGNQDAEAKVVGSTNNIKLLGETLELVDTKLKELK